MSEQVPKLGLKYWKLRARKLTLHLINVEEKRSTKLTRLKLTRILTIVAISVQKRNGNSQKGTD